MEEIARTEVFRGSLPPGLFRKVMLGGASICWSAAALKGPLGLLPLAMIAVGVLLILGSMARTAAARSIVGSDGIEVRGLGRARFIHFRDVVGTVPEQENGIRLCLASKKDVRLTAGPSAHGKKSGMRETQRRRDAAHEAMTAALRAFAERDERSPAAALVARGGRRPEEWSAALREIAARRLTYRTAAVPEEELLAVVSDVGAPDDARVGAALVLAHSRSADATMTERVRVATAATASPKLRIALEAAAGGDDEALALIAAAR